MKIFIYLHAKKYLIKLYIFQSSIVLLHLRERDGDMLHAVPETIPLLSPTVSIYLCCKQLCSQDNKYEQVPGTEYSTIKISSHRFPGRCNMMQVSWKIRWSLQTVRTTVLMMKNSNSLRIKIKWDHLRTIPNAIIKRLSTP